MNAVHPSGLPSNPLAHSSATNSPKTHPLILAAAVAVIFASSAAVANMFGLIGQPNSVSLAKPAAQSQTTLERNSSISPVSSAVAASTPESTPVILAPSASKAIPIALAAVNELPVAQAPSKPTPRIAAARQSAPSPIAQTGTAAAPQIATPMPQVIAQNSSLPGADSNVQAPVIASAPTPDYRTAPVPDYRSTPTPQPAVQAQYQDPNIGTVTSIREDQRKGQGSGMGAIAGGAVGGALGNQMGKGSGRTVATIIGAIGGGLIGNEIEKSQRVVTTYVATVRMQDGSTRNFNFSSRPALSVGDQFDIRSAPSGSQAQHTPSVKKPSPLVRSRGETGHESRPNETRPSDSMPNDNPYNT